MPRPDRERHYPDGPIPLNEGDTLVYGGLHVVIYLRFLDYGVWGSLGSNQTTTVNPLPAAHRSYLESPL